MNQSTKDAIVMALSDFIVEVDKQRTETHNAADRQVYDRYLCHVAIILAQTVRDEEIANNVSAMDRLLGNTWLVDEKAYSKVFSIWDNFKSLLIQSLSGMTVNERLFTLGLQDEFDGAVARKDASRVRTVLGKCFLDKESIENIIKNFDK